MNAIAVTPRRPQYKFDGLKTAAVAILGLILFMMLVTVIIAVFS